MASPPTKRQGHQSRDLWGCPPRLRLWAVQAAFKRALAGPAAPILAWTRAWLFLKKLKCDFEKQKSNGSLDIRALAAQRPPTRRPTIAGAHRRPDNRPKKPFLGLKRRETKRKSCPIVPNQKWPRSSVFRQRGQRMEGPILASKPAASGEACPPPSGRGTCFSPADFHRIRG